MREQAREEGLRMTIAERLMPPAAPEPPEMWAPYVTSLVAEVAATIEAAVSEAAQHGWDVHLARRGARVCIWFKPSASTSVLVHDWTDV